MAKDYNDYEELLKAFEDTSDIKRKASSSEKAPADNIEKEIENSRRERQKRVEDFNLNINNGNEKKPAYNGEVYFSNPPRTIKEEARRQQQSTKTAEKPAAEKKPAVPPATDTQKQLIALKNKKRAKRGKSGDDKGPSKAPKRILVLAIIIFFTSILSFYAISCINDIFALNSDTDTVEVTVSSNMTDKDVLKILKKNKLIKNKFFCTLFTDIVINDADEKNEYVSGSYTLSPSMGLEKMLSTMQANITSSETVTLTFPEGWTVDQIAEKLEANKVCTAASFVNTMNSVDFSSEYSFIATLDNKESRFRMLEGYIYPDTYDFYVGEGASSVIRRFLDNFKSKWTEKYQKRAKELNMSSDEIITLASIIQKEAANAKQMPTVSSILYNRLNKPSEFPWLQLDSTEDFLIKTIKPTLTSSTEDTQKYLAFRDFYDTHSTECKGLPGGAITNPGDSAIYAALYPEDTGYYYFRHDAKGKIYCASTLAEHEANGQKIASEDSDS